MEAAARLVPGLVPASQESPPKPGCCKAKRPDWRSTRAFFYPRSCAAGRQHRIFARRCCCQNPRRRRYCRNSPRTAGELPGAAIARHGKAAVVSSAIRGFSTPRTRPHSPAWRPASTSRCSTTGSRLRCCAGGRSSTPNTGAARFRRGINLTHLYQGRIPFLWYLERDLGYVNKLYRGLALPDGPPPENSAARPSRSRGSPRWNFRDRRPLPDPAGGGLRAGAKRRLYDLPARKEGIIPGAAICGCRARWATASPARRSSMSAGSLRQSPRGA